MQSLRLLLVCVFGLVIGCGDNKPFTPDAAAGPQCSDGIDNDGDGATDYPDDSACESADDDLEDGPGMPACNDNRDNDGDGKMDYPNDPGCQLPQGDSEADDCPAGPGCPQCSNGVDDDGNGSMDFPDDPGCTSAADASEFIDNPVACGAGLTIEQLPISGMDTGMLDGTSVSNLVTTCGGGAGAAGVAYVFHLTEPKVMVASTDEPGTMVDTVLDLRSADCEDPSSHITCNDDTGAGEASSITQSLAAGTYYLIVEGRDTSEMGAYTLNVQFFAGEGSECSTQDECGPGLVCRTPLGGSMMICTDPVCSDGADDDADGKTDFPNDPGCESPTDDTEDDDCPDGANCPACGDGEDNDNDGQTDYPADTACSSASGDNEACAGELDPIIAITTGMTIDTLVGATDEHAPSCGSDFGPDKIFTLDLPAMETLVINTNGSAFDTVLSLMNSMCGEPSIECDDDDGDSTQSLISRTAVAAGSYTIAVDAFSDNTTPAAFVINVTGTVTPGESCEGALFQSGALSCAGPNACNGPIGSRTCSPAQCSDGIDNNGAGGTDYPVDPGCTSPADNTETTVCPGPDCPVCSDGLDNDMDGFTDYPDDLGCAAASSTNEGCTGEIDPIADITAATTTGTLVGASDDHNPSCGADGGPDKVFVLEIPTLQSLVIDTEGSTVDTVLSLMNSSCGEPSLACDDDAGVGTGDSLISDDFVPGGTYTIAVDARSSSTTPDTFNLNVRGTIVPGGSCEVPLFQAGALTCTTGFACDGPAGSRTCRQAQCLDGIDNNANGVTDFPFDPGCDDPSDNTETTVCPGPDCPLCSDTLDNDGDGAIDFPADTACDSAAGTQEACAQTEPVGAITQMVTSGTTVGLTHDYVPACNSSNAAPDVALRLDLPAMDSLSLAIVGFNTVHSLLDTTCGGAPIVCSDPANASVTSLSAGTYYVVVDGSGSTSGDWTLTTTGVVAAGESCEGPLFQAGAFTCTAGSACKGVVGSRTCAPTMCNDGVDNNGDGTMDYPDDPSCTSSSDDSEEDVTCPGAACPVCANGMDDDGDTFTDYPDDLQCPAASFVLEDFCAVDPDIFGMITGPTTQGTLASPAADNYDQSCQGNTTNDAAYLLQLPVAVASLTIDTEGSTVGDTVLSLKDAQCGTELDCDDDGASTANHSLITVSNVAAGNYAIQVDSFSTGNNGPFTLNVSGTVASGTDCTSSLFTSGVLACPTGTTCTAGTCQ